MKRLLGNVGEIHTPKINSNFRRTATPPPESYSLFDDFDLIEDQLLFSSTNSFYDKDAGMFHVSIPKNKREKHLFISVIGYLKSNIISCFVFSLLYTHSILDYPFSGK